MTDLRKCPWEIPLTNGGCAIVDEEDFERVNQYKWFWRQRKYVKYAIGYIHNGTKWKQIRMHRFILGSSSPIIDHVNRDGLDNRKTNLRVCEATGNARNRWKVIGLSKYKGVYLSRQEGNKNKPWAARIRTDNGRIFLGYFSTEKEAGQAYAAACQRYHGPFACPLGREPL